MCEAVPCMQHASRLPFPKAATVQVPLSKYHVSFLHGLFSLQCTPATMQGKTCEQHSPCICSAANSKRSWQLTGMPGLVATVAA